MIGIELYKSSVPSPQRGFRRYVSSLRNQRNIEKLMYRKVSFSSSYWPKLTQEKTQSVRHINQPEQLFTSSSYQTNSTGNSRSQPRSQFGKFRLLMYIESLKIKRKKTLNNQRTPTSESNLDRSTKLSKATTNSKDLGFKPDLRSKTEHWRLLRPPRLSTNQRRISFEHGTRCRREKTGSQMSIKQSTSCQPIKYLRSMNGKSSIKRFKRSALF